MFSLPFFRCKIRAARDGESFWSGSDQVGEGAKKRTESRPSPRQWLLSQSHPPSPSPAQLSSARPNTKRSDSSSISSSHSQLSHPTRRRPELALALRPALPRSSSSSHRRMGFDLSSLSSGLPSLYSTPSPRSIIDGNGNGNGNGSGYPRQLRARSVRRGVCKFFNASKGFGFIVDQYPEELGGQEGALPSCFALRLLG